MRLATIATPDGPRLHVRGRSGYVDVAAETGDAGTRRRSSGSWQSGPLALDRLRRLAELDGRAVSRGRVRARDARAAARAVPGPELLRARARGRPRGARPGPTRSSAAPTACWAPTPTWSSPALTERFDYEAELGIVIGAGGRYIRADKALDAIAGFVVLNDASARDWQRAASQWTAGKNFEGSMPIGPEVVTPDEVDVSDLAISSTLNGTVMQSSRTSLMLVDVPSAVEFFSSFTRLVPGDVIATGTPAASDSPASLRSGCSRATSSRSPSSRSAPSATASSPRPTRPPTGGGSPWRHQQADCRSPGEGP